VASHGAVALFTGSQWKVACLRLAMWTRRLQNRRYNSYGRWRFSAEKIGMAIDCIKVWKYEDAPSELKLGRGGSDTPQWLALIPRALMGSDLSEAMQARSQRASLLSYQFDDGNIVITGSTREDVFMEAVGCTAQKDSRSLRD
jgi:hypothetical protein